MNAVVGWVAGVAFICTLLSVGTNLTQNDQIRQLRVDVNTQQQAIAAEQAQNRRYEATIEQFLRQQAETSASVTTTTCTLHDIYASTPGC